MNRPLKPYSIVVRKDNTGFYNAPSIGSQVMMFLGVSPQNSELAVVAHTRQDVVGAHLDVDIVALPYSVITLEPLSNLKEAPNDVLEKVGVL